MVDVEPVGWRSLWRRCDRPRDGVDEVQLLAAAYFWQDPRTAPRPAAARPN